MAESEMRNKQLWFDVGIVRYTTGLGISKASSMLWFDVGIVRYTTEIEAGKTKVCCGLM